MPSLNLMNSTAPWLVFQSGFSAKMRARAEASELSLSYESGMIRRDGGGPPFEVAEGDMVDDKVGCRSSNCDHGCVGSCNRCCKSSRSGLGKLL